MNRRTEQAQAPPTETGTETGDIWQTRNEALAALNSSLKPHGDAIREMFALIDTSISDMEKVAEESGSNSRFASVAGLTALKGRNLGLAAYSLALDGLAQEAGAVLRPLIEVLELLRYIRTEPHAIDQALDGKLPTAGGIARKIDGTFHGLRRYLNDNAAHFGFTPDALRHMLDFNAGAKFRIVQSFRAGVPTINLGHVFCFLTLLAFESVNCLAKTEHMPVSAQALLGRIERCRDNGVSLFKPYLELYAEA